MKLNEKRGTRDRRPKSLEILGKKGEVSSLMEQLGLPRRIEIKLREFLESTEDGFDAQIQRVEVAGLLTTLFPAEAEEFRHQAPIEELVRALPRMSPPESGIAMKVIKLVSPNQPLTIPENLFQSDVFSDPKIFGSVGDALTKLNQAAQVAILFPNRESDNKKQAQRLFDQQKKVRRISIDLLEGLFYLLYLDPTLHRQIQNLVKSRSSEFETMFDKIRAKEPDVPITMVATYFAAYKLFLADEIQQLPSGLLVAVEPGDIGQTAPLPERSMA